MDAHGTGSSPADAVPPPPPRRRAPRLVVIVGAVVLVLAGGGSAAAFLILRGSGEELLQLVPASSDVVVTAYLDPSAGQKVNLLALAHRFPALRDDDRVRRGVDEVLDGALRGVGLQHDDVRPWLGSQVALAVEMGTNVPVVSVFVATVDDAAAQSSLQKALRRSMGSEDASEYRGVTMHVFGAEPSFVGYAIVDHVVVLSNHGIGLTRAIDVSEATAAAIEDDPEFRQTVSSLPEARLGLAYMNGAEVLGRVLGSSGLTMANAPGLDMLEAMRGMAMTVSAHPDGLAVDTAVRLDSSKLDPATRDQLDRPLHDNGTLEVVPADSYVVAAQQGLDASLKGAVDQALSTPEGERIRERLGVDEALAALTGDVALEIGPGTGEVPAGAVAIGVTDPSAVGRTLDGLAELALSAARGLDPIAPDLGDVPGSTGDLGLADAPRPRWRTSTYEGTTIRYLDDPHISDMGLVPAYAVLDGAAILASSPGEIRKVIDARDGVRPNITSSTAYATALGRIPGSETTFYLNAAAVISRLAPELPPDVGANLEPVRTVVAGGSDSSSLISGHLFVEIG
jgi:hypothetical protein